MKITKDELIEIIELVEGQIEIIEETDKFSNIFTSWDKQDLNLYKNLIQKLETELYNNKKEIVINVENN